VDAGPRPTNAEMAQLVALLEERGLIEVYLGDQGREAYRLTEEGVRVGHMLAMVEGEDANAVLEALLRGDEVEEPQAQRRDD
jgi:DNA-binding PadR family transcriptional regulator